MYFDLSIPSQLAGALLPDLILVIGAMLLLLFAVWGPETMGRARATGILTIAVCAASFAAVVWLWHGEASASAGIIAVDAFRWATDCIVLAATIIAATLMIDYSEREQLVSAESYVLLLLAAGGMLLLAASRDLIIVFLGIELMSIASYVLCGLDRRSSRGAEAALKYFLLGAFSTGFLLYGIALIYGATGSTDIATIGTLVTGATFNDPMLLAGIGLLVVGFCFKVAAVPFHMWTPDVYEGAATPITAFMAAAVKAAAFAAFLRVWIEAFPGATAAWVHPLQWLAVITMIGGNVIALQQKSMKRMLAYSSIAHAGYLLVTVVVANALGASAFLFYLVAYTLATMGAFAVVIALGEPGERVGDRGLRRTVVRGALARRRHGGIHVGAPRLSDCRRHGLLREVVRDRRRAARAATTDAARRRSRAGQRDLRGLLPRRRARDVHEAARGRCARRAPRAHRHLSRDLPVRVHAPALRRVAQRFRGARA